jgi:hypothetical protein
MLLLDVMMRKHAILLRQHAPQTLGRVRICTCFACFIRTRSGDGAACGGYFQRALFHYNLTIANNIIDNVLSTRPDYDTPVGAGCDHLIGFDTALKRQLAVDQRRIERAAVEQRGEPIEDGGGLD